MADRSFWLKAQNLLFLHFKLLSSEDSSFHQLMKLEKLIRIRSRERRLNKLWLGFAFVAVQNDFKQRSALQRDMAKLVVANPIFIDRLIIQNDKLNRVTQIIKSQCNLHLVADRFIMSSDHGSGNRPSQAISQPSGNCQQIILL